MSTEILVNSTNYETRVVLTEHGLPQEIYIERPRRRGLVGNLYKGRVARVLPGMQAAFIDVGDERTAFLHASDIDKLSYAEIKETTVNTPDIRHLLQPGEAVLVQVLKDPMGTKGARVTTRISIPSRYMVYVPGGQGIGVSNRIEDANERQRLKDIVAMVRPENIDGGYIVRTAGEGAAMEALRADMLYLSRLWQSIQRTAQDAPAATLIHEDLALPLRVLRDLLDAGVDLVRVDDHVLAARMQQFAEMFIPEFAARITLYEGDRPIFDLYGIEDEITRALERRVDLKSGGYLIFDQTEAMTTIDVNTGAYIGQRNLEQTILKTNLEAAQVIARQLRLRNLGGIIIIDFIDMEETAHRDLVLGTLERGLARDHAKTHITAVSELGLVEMTRKRTRESLEHVLCDACPTCQGRGSVKTAESICFDLYRELLRLAPQFEAQEYLILAPQSVIDLLLDEESANLAEMEAQLGHPLRLQVEGQYRPEQFDVIPM